MSTQKPFMHPRLRRALLVGYSALAFVHATLQPVHPKDIHLMTFNAQNLFDGIESGEEYADYRPPHWNTTLYETRLLAIGTALQSIPYPLDVIVLQEVENRTVVEDLRTYYLPAFTHIAVTDNPHGAVELAIMSKHKIISTHTYTLQHRSPNAQFRALRPLLDVSIAFSLPPHQRVQILAVHLKSQRKSRSALSSKTIRAHQYKLIAKAIDARIPSIIAGDFNDIKPIQSLSLHNTTLIRPRQSTYDTMRDHRGMPIDGTYYYKSQWQSIDHVLIDAVFNAATHNTQTIIIAKPPFINDKGLPNRFNTYERAHAKHAVSDHLPLVFVASW